MALVWDLGKAEPRRVGRDASIAVSEPRNQFAVLKCRCRQAMKQQHNRRAARTRFAIKHFDAVGLDAVNRRAWNSQILNRFLNHLHFSSPPRLYSPTTTLP